MPLPDGSVPNPQASFNAGSFFSQQMPYNTNAPVVNDLNILEKIIDTAGFAGGAGLIFFGIIGWRTGHPLAKRVGAIALALGIIIALPSIVDFFYDPKPAA